MVVAELEVHGEGQLFKDVVTLQAEFFHKLSNEITCIGETKENSFP